MTAFVVADVHGNLDALASLLRQAEILDDDWERVDRGTRVIQLGDLCNCVASSVVDDHRCLDHVAPWIDDYLVGNHEYPYFGGPAFAVFHRDLLLADRLRRLNDIGIIKPCVAVDGVLVSHAGLVRDLPVEDASAEAFAERATLAWRRDPTLPLFSAIGRSRGGWTPQGGILWSDWDEPKSREFPQVVGHTVGDSIRWQHDGDWFAVCIDLGAKTPGSRIAGAWIHDDRVDVLIHEPKAIAT